MRIHRIGMTFAALLAAQFMASGCILTPTIEDRIVELVTTESVVVPLHAGGSVGVLTSNPTGIQVPSSDVMETVEDAGLDLEDLVSITVQKVDYRITVADPEPTRTVNGSIQVDAGTGVLPGSPNPTIDLITGFSGAAGAPTGWTSVALSSAGVTELNSMLATMLSDFKAHAPGQYWLAYDASGTATGGGNTNFDYEVRLTLNIVGKIETQTLTSK